MGTDSQGFYELNKFVTLTLDVMHANGIPFLAILSHGIRLETTKFQPSHTAQLDNSEALCTMCELSLWIWNL